MSYLRKSLLSAVLVLFIISLVTVPLLEAKQDLDYNKKLFRHLKKRDIEKLPSNDDFPGADAIIIHDETLKEQFFGYYSLWDISYKEIRYKVWKVINPGEERLQKVVIDLGNNKQVEEFELLIFPFKGETKRFKKVNLQLQTYTYPEGGTEYKRAYLELPKMEPNVIIEMEYTLNVSQTLFWESIYLQGPDPIISTVYEFRPPEFIKLSPTQLYGPVAHSNPLLYKFRAYDSVKKKLLVPKTKNGFSFSFGNLPAIRVGPQLLPKAKQSSFVAFCVNGLILKDPVGRYDASHMDYMQISPGTQSNFIRSAGSPEAYKIPFNDWASVADYLYYEVLEGIQNSELFASTSKEIVGDLQNDMSKQLKIYKFMSQEFAIDDFRPSKLYVLPLKDLEKSLKNRKSHRFDMGFIFWGLLHHAGISGKLGFGFSHDEFIGEFDRKFPMPIEFNTSFVIVGQGEKARINYPGDPAIRMGSYPPEIEGADFLIVTMKSKTELADENLYQTDKLNPYIKVRQNTRLTAGWQILQVGSPTVNKVSSKFELVVSEDGTISTTAQTIFNGHEETMIRRELGSMDKQAAEKYARDWYEKQAEKAEIVSVTIKHLNDFGGSLEFNAELLLPFTVKDNTLTIPFSFFNQTNMLPVTEEQKKLDTLLFPYRSFVWNDFMVTFDKGWKAKSTLLERKIQAEEGMIATNIRQTDIQFNYQRGFTLTKVFLKGKEIQDLSAYFSKIKELEMSDVLVLEKM